MIAVEDVYREWNRELLRGLRRRFSTTPFETLEDAASHAWVQFVRNQPPDEYALAWLKLVARHEVFHLVKRAELTYDELPRDAGGYTLDEQLEARELLDRVRRLKPTQRTALTCKLLGLSYEQTQQATGRTYTWVNRHVTEGRAALREAA
jgi:DNA-directed RNA polymerase specialized sigma24 family protein